MKSVLKNLLFLTLILGVSFGGGFYFGAFPDALLERFGLYKGKLRWICTEVCPTPETLIKIQEQTQIDFQMIESIHTAEDLRSTSIRADIITASRAMLGAIKEELTVFEEGSYRKSLHPDFEALITKDKVGLPLFWKSIPDLTSKKTVIRVYSLGFFLESRLTEEQKDILIQALINTNTQTSWMKEKKLSSALGEFDSMENIKPEEKPSFLRTYSLQDITIEE